MALSGLIDNALMREVEMGDDYAVLLLTLQSYVYRFGYLQGHLWHIPQTDLQQGLLKAMETDSSIRHRADSLALTAKDVTLLMSCATQGKVRLELDDNPY
jgi:hypothetical protein